MNKAIHSDAHVPNTNPGGIYTLLVRRNDGVRRSHALDDKKSIAALRAWERFPLVQRR